MDSIVSFCVALAVFAGQPAHALSEVRLGWDPNPEADISGYNVYYGSSSGVYPHKVAAGNTTTFTVSNLEAETAYFFVVTAENEAGLESLPSDEVFTVTAPVAPPAAVEGRYIFYNNSAWDGNDPTANINDDAAIAPDKFPLLPGNVATFANYTSFSRGINGIMIDIADLANPAGMSAADFAFRLGNDNNPLGWTSASTSVISSITVRPGQGTGGTDRVSLLFNENSIQNQWLEVTVLANAGTGLQADDVFYFGNAIGETGDSPSNAVVNGIDQAKVRVNSRTSSNPGPITDPFDFNRDKFVNGFDEIKARVFSTGSSTALKLINLQPELASITVPAASASAEVAPSTAGSDVPEVSSGTENPLTLELTKPERAAPHEISVYRTANGLQLVIFVPQGSLLESSDDLSGPTWRPIAGASPSVAQESVSGGALWTIRFDRLQRFFRIAPSQPDL
ncbi:MAG: fibronectin type III domain-containing protein [Verrucomicrobiales bacterium]